MIEIGKCAFVGCSGLQGITIPYSVISLNGFMDCTGLTNITIPDSVKEIGERTFAVCTGLTNMIIPKSVCKIEENAFSDCTGLESITIPDSVLTIEDSTFYGCKGLKSIQIPGSVTVIADWAFANCDNLANAVIINPKTKIKDYAFPENTEIIRKEGATTPQSRMKLKDYVPNLNYIFEEFDTDAFDGSFYTKDGVLSELFSSEDILEALDEDGEKYVDEMSDEDIHDAVANVALLLNQGSIKSLEISNGNKIIYEDSNDKPFLD